MLLKTGIAQQNPRTDHFPLTVYALEFCFYKLARNLFSFPVRMCLDQITHLLNNCQIIAKHLRYFFICYFFVPFQHTNVEGAFSTRGETISVVNLAKCLGMAESTEKEKDMFLITNFNGLTVGFHVHGVVGIHRVNWSAIVKPDSLINNASSGVATGIVNFDGKLVILLSLISVNDVHPSAAFQYR